MFHNEEWGPMLRFDRQKVVYYNRFDNIVSCIMLITTSVVIFSAILNAEPLSRVCLPIFYCDILAVASWSWNIFYQSYKIHYGYEKRHAHYIAWIFLRLALIVLMFYAGCLHGIEFVHYWQKVRSTSMLAPVVATIGLIGAICYIGTQISILLYYRAADHWTWHIYSGELNMDEEAVSFPEYCQFFTK